MVVIHNCMQRSPVQYLKDFLVRPVDSFRWASGISSENVLEFFSRKFKLRTLKFMYIYNECAVSKG